MNQTQAPSTAAEAPPAPIERREDAKPRQRKSKRKTYLVLGAAALLVAVWLLRPGRGGTAPGADLTPTTVTRGDVQSLISSSGTVKPIEQYDVVSLVSGEILADYLTVGDEVSKDQLLYVLDSENVENNIRKAELALQQQELSYQRVQESVGNLTVGMPISGTLTALYVKEGDSVNTGAKICDIVDQDRLTVKLPFHESDAANLFVGQPALVYLEDSGEQCQGSVTERPSGSTVTAAGNIVTHVTLSFDNPGAVIEGSSATAIVGDYACAGAGRVEFGRTETVTAKSAGEVTGLGKVQGDRVSAGEVLLSLDNRSLLLDSQSGALSLEDRRLSLNDSYRILDNYNLKSPINGTVISKSYKAGDKLDANRTTLAVVADMSRLIFTMNIDELDVKNLREGQQVQVTADAMEGVTFTGLIDSIGIIGSGGAGVTYYPVDVIIAQYEGLLPGMNVNADIVIDQARDVLRLPVAAVSRGDVVLISQEEADRLGAAYPAADDAAGNGAQQGGAAGNGAQPGDTPGNGAQQGSAAGNGAQPGDTSGNAAPQGGSPNGRTQQGGTAGGRVQTGGLSTFAVQAPGTLVERAGNPEGYVWLKVETGLADDNFIEIRAGLDEGATVYIQPTAVGAGNFFMGGMPGGNVRTTVTRGG
ncbi:MAG: HlyD family efflux transporter periplasmic adaptor subunit [Clostridiales bacterium]|nr:HlyD family efflux transporter periplasmic adaptor subunit [Clostridiales bacterium]